jgi:hypothetical protein
MVRYLLAELRRGAVRLSGALIVYALITRVPWPSDVARWVGVGSAALLVSAFLIVCGSVLYNTLFYDHYWRQVDSR